MSTVINRGTNVPQWTFPPAFREAVSGIAHRPTNEVLEVAMGDVAGTHRATLVDEHELLPPPKALDMLRATYVYVRESDTLVHNSTYPQALPWDEAITLVLTNLKPVDLTKWRSD